MGLLWTAVLLRAPAAIADRRQLPISIVLAFSAFGSLTIQSWFGRAVNDFTGITAFNNLVQGLSGIASQAVLLEFIILTYPNSNGTSRLRVLRIGLACAVASRMGINAGCDLTSVTVTPAPVRPRTFDVSFGFCFGSGPATGQPLRRS
jgi:hypothetical protein